MRENTNSSKINSSDTSVKKALNDDEQLSPVAGGMYHGYARSGGNGMIAGMPPHSPGVLGPGMGYRPANVEPPPLLNPMTSQYFADMRPGTMGPGLNNYYTTEKQASFTEE